MAGFLPKQIVFIMSIIDSNGGICNTYYIYPPMLYKTVIRLLAA